jgi:two-component system OmpR family sensor kinase
LKQYEKSALIRFFLLLFGAFMLMFLLIATLYYLQEHTRLSKELALNAQLEYIECMKLEMGGCRISENALAPNMTEVYHHILIVLGLLLLIFIPISLYLSFFSVRPVRQASTMIDNFIANIVHDINTPISTIMLNSKSLLKRSTGPTTRLSRILASSKQLQGMQHDLLALADEKIELERQEIDLKQITVEIVEDFQLTYSNQPFEMTLDETLVHVNLLDLQRIIQNLISNSVKYNRNHNPIKLYTEENTLVIEDEGRGMKRPEKIFEKNYREDYTIQGNGIGLASVMAMLNRNHIEITVSSQIHQGTTIHLDFTHTCIKDTP